MFGVTEHGFPKFLLNIKKGIEPDLNSRKKINLSRSIAPASISYFSVEFYGLGILYEQY